MKKLTTPATPRDEARLVTPPAAEGEQPLERVAKALEGQGAHSGRRDADKGRVALVLGPSTPSTRAYRAAVRNLKAVSAPTGSVARVRFAWFDEHGQIRRAHIGEINRLHDASPGFAVRRAPKYKGQLSYQGHYWFAGVQALVWHESMAEYATLMLLDHSRTVHNVFTQPLVLFFPDGTRHTPDYLMDDGGGQRVVVDVHIESMTKDADREKFELTRLACNALGWEYLLFDELPEVVVWNLEMIARYRHPRYAPSNQQRGWLMANVQRHLRFEAVRLAIGTERVGEH